MSDSGKAVFLSYASQDADAAKRIADALRAAGVEVWFDQSELVGGDAWDQKIRKQIKDCALLIPIISAATQARTEGYFRLEWRLADQRTHLMGRGRTFLLPVCIDETKDADADVPDSFSAVQWTRLPGGETPVVFAERVKRLLDGGSSSREAASRTASQASQELSPPKKKSRLWLAPVLLVLFAGAAFVIRQPWRQSEKPLVVPAPAALSPAAAELARVRAQLTPDRWQREDFAAMAPTLDRLIEANPESSDAWAMRSIINSLQVLRNFDSSTKPLEVGKAAADRALRLVPGSPLAEIAFGMHLVAMTSRGGDARACRPYLDRGVAALPPDALTRYAELASYWFAYDFDQVQRCAQGWLDAEPQASFPPWIFAQLNAVRRRADEAEKWAELAVADPNITGVRAFNTMFESKYYLRGDLSAAWATLQRVPPVGRSVHRIVHARWLLSVAGHRWDEALQELAQMPETFLFDRSYHGPKALLAGLAHRGAGRADAAAAQFREAERLLKEHLATDSDNEELHTVLAVTLACAGRGAEARSELALVEPLVKGRSPSIYRGSLVMTIAQAYAVLGDSGPLAFWLRKLLAEPSQFPFTPASIRVDARFTGMLNAPEIQALLKEFVSLDQPVAAAAIDAKSVAVLAFANLSDDKGNEYFSDGISEELLNVLAKIPGLKVMARTSSFYFKGKEVPIPEIAQQLGVAYVVEGSVRKQGDKVRITAQLIKAADGFHVWSDTFTRDLKDIFAVQDEIAGLIAQQLQLKLGGSTRVAKVVNPEAYRLLLEGRQFWNLRTAEGFAKAEVAFTKALTIDPQFAEAHAGLAGVYVIRSVYRELDGIAIDADDLQRADSEGRRALEIDPSSAEAHAALGHVDYFAHRLGDSDRNYQQALALSPNSALVHCWYALLLSTQGRLDASLQHYQMAAELDPLWFINLHMLGGELAFAQRFDQSLGIIERAAALRTGIFLHNTAGRAWALLALGRKEDAFEAARHILSHPDVSPRWNSDAVAIRVLWEGGRRQEAEDEAARLLARWPQDFYLRGFTLVALGRFDEALPYLTRTPSSMARSLYWESMWDPWREDPRFKQLIVKLGRAEEYKVGRQTLARMLKEREGK